MVYSQGKLILENDESIMEIYGDIQSIIHNTNSFSEEWDITITTPREMGFRTYKKNSREQNKEEEKEEDTMTIERIKTQKMSAEEFEESNDTFDEITIWLNVDKVDKFKAKYGMKLEYKYNFYDDIVEISPSAFKIRGIVIPKDFVEFIEVKEKVGA